MSVGACPTRSAARYGKKLGFGRLQQRYDDLEVAISALRPGALMSRAVGDLRRAQRAQWM